MSSGFTGPSSKFATKPFDAEGEAEAEAAPWFLPADPDEVASPAPLLRAGRGSLLDAAGWRAAEAAQAADLAELAFEFGRLSERVAAAGQGAVQRLALEEAASLSWWSGDRVTADRLALWLSYRIGAVEEGGDGLIRIAWAARRLAASASGPGRGLTEALAASLGEGGGRILAFWTMSQRRWRPWRALDERPDHLRGLEAAVLGARLAAGQGALPFLPLTLVVFSALTASGSPEARLAGWITGAQRAVLSALLALDRLAQWRARAMAETADLQGRTPARLIAALAAQPMLAAPQAEAETGASRAAVQRNLDVLVDRGLIREVTGQGRFRVWAVRF